MPGKMGYELTMATQNGQPDTRRTVEISRNYQSGYEYHRAGQLDRAETMYRMVLRNAPGHVDALHHLGVIAHARGRHEYAVQLISQALTGAPALADAHLDLGRALRALGRLDEAAAASRRAIGLKPEFAIAHSNLATILNLQGAYGAALESADRALELMPGLAEAHFNRGVALARQDLFVEAEAAYRGALALAPNSAETLSELGAVLTVLERFEEAIACHQQAAALSHMSSIVHLRLAEALIRVGDPYGAEAAWRRGLAIEPKEAKAWSGLGQTLRIAGRFDEALSCFRRALAIEPDLPDAFAGLAIIGQRPNSEEQLRPLRELLARADCVGPTRINALYALGMLLDSADRTDEAFSCFAEGNTLRRQHLATLGQTFDIDELRRRVDGLIESCTTALYSTVEGDGNPSELPVFVVGMPRSGTSLIEQIAATHSRVLGAGELRDVDRIFNTIQAHGQDRPAEQLDPDLAHRLADGYVARLESLGMEKSRVIDKMPDNILHLGLVGVLFSGARVIFCRRDLRDTCLSCYFCHFDQPVLYSHDLADCGLRALEIERLADHWRSVLPLRMLTIDYEALVADLESESRRLIEFLGLDWEPACLEFHKTERPVMTASGWQVRQPLFSRSIGRWRKYEPHLGPLLEVLARHRSRA